MSDEKILTQFGKAVHAQRAKLKISQEELAERAGLHRTYISDIERGSRNVSLLNIHQIAKALELSTVELFRQADKAWFALK